MGFHEITMLNAEAHYTNILSAKSYFHARFTLERVKLIHMQSYSNSLRLLAPSLSTGLGGQIMFYDLFGLCHYSLYTPPVIFFILLYL